MKKALAIFMVAVLCLSLCACDFLKDMADSTKLEEAKTFDFDGISIELTNKFLRMDFVSEEYDFIVGNEDITVMGIKVLVAETDLQSLSVSEYAQNFRLAMEDENPTEISDLDGIPTMQYNATTDDGDKQTIALMFYKGEDCFWVLCFATQTEDFDDYYEDICKYAKTVKCE